MNNIPTIDFVTALRYMLMATGFILAIVYGGQAVAQATSWQAVAGVALKSSISTNPRNR